MHTYIIRGSPTPWARARQNGRQFYDSQRPIKNTWAISLENQAEGQPFYQKTPLHLEAVFYFEPPISYKPLTRINMMGKPCILKKDLDNLIKFLLDTVTSILIDDDAHVYSINAQKIYDAEARTEFSFTPFQDSPIQKTNSEPQSRYLKDSYPFNYNFSNKGK